MGEALRPLKSLADWREAVTAARNVVNHSRAERTPAKKRIRKSRKAEFMSSLASGRSRGVSPPASPYLESKRYPTDAETGQKHADASCHSCKETKERQLQLFVNSSCGSPLCLQVHPSTTVSALKGSLHDKLGIPPDKQHLFTRKNAELDDALSLEECNIQQDANVELRLVSGLMGGTGDHKSPGKKKKKRKSSKKHQPEQASVEKSQKDPGELTASPEDGVASEKQTNPGRRGKRRKSHEKPPPQAEAKPGENDSSADEKQEDSEASHSSDAEDGRRKAGKKHRTEEASIDESQKGPEEPHPSLEAGGVSSQQPNSDTVNIDTLSRRRRKIRENGKKPPSLDKAKPDEKDSLVNDRRENLEDSHTSATEDSVADQPNPERNPPEEVSVEEKRKDPKEPRLSSPVGAASNQQPTPVTRRRRKRGKKSPSQAEAQPESDSSAAESQDDSDSHTASTEGSVTGQPKPGNGRRRGRKNGKKPSSQAEESQSSSDEKQEGLKDFQISAAECSAASPHKTGRRRRRKSHEKSSPEAEAKPENDSPAEERQQDSETLHASSTDDHVASQPTHALKPRRKKTDELSDAEMKNWDKLLEALIIMRAEEEMAELPQESEKSDDSSDGISGNLPWLSQQPTQQAATATEGIPDTTLHQISEKLGRGWGELALHFNFTDDEIAKLVFEDPDDDGKQAYKMLVHWKDKELVHLNQADKLYAALKEIKRLDVADMFQDLMKTSQQCGSPSADGAGLTGNSQNRTTQDAETDPAIVRISEKILDRISKELSADWDRLAVYLNFKQPDIDCIVQDYQNNTRKQAYTMLHRWESKQPAGVDRTEVLCDALKEVDRMDVALKLKELLKTSPKYDYLMVGRSDNAPVSSQKQTTQDAATVKTNANDPAQIAADCCEGVLKYRYRNTGSYVQLIPWVDDNTTHVRDIYTNLQLMTEGKDGKKLQSYEKIFLRKTKDGDLVPIAVLVGLPGRGKTTLVDKMGYDWAVGLSKVLRKYKLVFVLKMYALEQSSDLLDAIFVQLLPEDTNVEKRDLELFIRRKPDKVLILLDGFDDLRTTSLNESSFGSIFKILNRKLCIGCCVVITTRPSHFERLVTKHLVQKPFTHVMVSGFTAEDIARYVHRFYSLERERAKGLLDRIRSSDILYELAKSPMLLLLMCLLWNENSRLPETMSRLYMQAAEFIFKRKAGLSLEEMMKVLVDTGKVGLEGLLSPDQILSFREAEFENSMIDIAVQAGLLSKDRVIKDLDAYNSIQFIHKSFQEFCAAQYMQIVFKENRVEFQKTVDQIASEGPVDFEYLIRFACGDNEECTKYFLQVCLEKFPGSLSLDEEIGQLALNCYFEGQYKSLPPVEFLDSFMKECIVFGNLRGDCARSLTYFLRYIAGQTEGGGKSYLSQVQKVEVLEMEFARFSKDIAYLTAEMANLRVLILSDCSFVSSSVRDMAFTLSSAKSLTELDLSFNTLGGSAKWFVHNLRQLKHLQKLNLGGCALESVDMEHIATALCDLSSLVELNLSDNEDLFTGSPAPLWLSLKHLKCLQKLRLACCSLSCQHLIDVIESLSSLPEFVELDFSTNSLGGSERSWPSCLQHMKHIQRLNFQECLLTGKDMEHVCNSLGYLPSLIELNLSDNEDLSGSPVSFWSSLKSLNHLQKLLLIRCSLTNADVKHVCESVLDLHNLMELDLSGNENLAGSAVLWSRSLKHLKHIQRLTLRLNALVGEDVEHVIKSLIDLPKLVQLDMSHNDLGGSVIQWPYYLKDLKHLQKLDLGHCDLKSEHIKYIIESLCDIPGLTELCLSGNRLGDSAALWSSRLKYLKQLQTLGLSWCQLTGEDVKYITDSLRRLSNLKELDLSGNNLGGSAANWSHHLQHLKQLRKLDLTKCSLTVEDKNIVRDLAMRNEVFAPVSNLRGAGRRTVLQELESLSKLK